jgi:hypothetical protein
MTLVAALAAGWLQVATPMMAAAAQPTLDFGNVTVGDSLPIDAELPLSYSLSDLPPETVLYAGGDPSIDFVLASSGINSLPVTAGSLIAEVGDMTATYHLGFNIATGTHFSVDSTDCLTATGSTCAASVTFAPTAQGPHSDTVVPQLSDIDVTGGGSIGSLADLMAPFIAPQVEAQLVLPVTGYGATPTSGLELRVTVPREAAPCVLLDATSIDFGTLPFSTEAALSQSSADVTVTSCSTGSQALYANGTDATGTSGALWSLSSVGGNPCGIGVNAYGVSLGTDGSGGMPAAFQLSTLASSWIVQQAEASVASSVDYQMPCVGSDGAGQTMTSQVSFLATVP